MTRLRYLYLTSTKVSGAGLVHLKGLANLQGLSLQNSKITNAGLDWQT